MPRRSRIFLAALSSLLIFIQFTSLTRGASLRVEVIADGVAITLVDHDTETTPWLLQHSGDGRTWEDLMFFASPEGNEELTIDVPWRVLQGSGSKRGFFRALQLEETDKLLERLLSERAKWRLSGIRDYRYSLSQSFGQISWSGVIEVADDEVASYETTDLQPPVVGVPEVPTIEELFSRIARAIAADAATINVTWDPTYGFPTTCFIDLYLELTDEERRWSIDSFVPPD